MQKKNYIAPQTELITLVTEPIMGNVSPTPQGPGVSEQTQLFEEGDAAARGHNTWEDED